MEEALKTLYQSRFGGQADSVVLLKGDGSARKIFRLSGGGRGVIGIANSDRQENAAFLEFSRHFRKCGLPVPEIYAEDREKGIYLEEDLGDLSLFQLLSERRTPEGIPEDVIRVYRQAVETLPKFQISAGKTLDYSVCYPRAGFDKQSMMWDLNHFKYYFLRLSRIPFNEQALEDDFERLADFLLKADRDFFLYRDFQSRNIMIRGGAPFFIDYQGGRKGALQYDIASLVSDAKADLPFELRRDLLDLYLDAASALARVDRAGFMKYYYGYVYIRILQAMGTYGLRGLHERKSLFLQSIPYAVRNIEFLLRNADLPVSLPALMQVLQRMVGSSHLRQFGAASLTLTVRVHSFSYRDGIPQDESGHGGGFVFDCRALPNPGKYETYSKRTGTDPEVVEFLRKEPAVERFMARARDLVDQSVEDYRKRNFTHLMVAFGCTGGQHRSVYCSELLARHLREKYGVAVEVRHLELEKKQGAPAS